MRKKLDPVSMRIIRETLKINPTIRQRAVSDFVLRVANVAVDMKKILDSIGPFGKATPETAEVLAMMEARIRDVHRECLGEEMAGDQS